MSKVQVQYSEKSFSERLKKLRIYRDYKSQTMVSEELGITKQVWSLWELEKRFPTFIQIIMLANFLKVDINYFFTPNADPQEYDLTLRKKAVK